MLASAVAIGCVIVSAVLMRSSPGDRPATLTVRDHAFVAPRRRVTVIATSIQFAGLSLLITNSTFQLSRLPVGTVGRAVDGIIVTSFVAITVVHAMTLRRPALSITPAGVRLDLRMQTWDTLAARRPTFGYALNWRVLPRFRVMAVDPTFAGAVVDYYLSAPEARTGIGTPDGYAQLRSALGVPA
jgi:hypothetical protein